MYVVLRQFSGTPEGILHPSGMLVVHRRGIASEAGID